MRGGIFMSTSSSSIRWMTAEVEEEEQEDNEEDEEEEEAMVTKAEWRWVVRTSDERRRAPSLQEGLEAVQ